MATKVKETPEKLSKFSEKLSQLRKERGISQKKASSDLGISQALLSHYEKGIRECGLEFVIKCSQYYGVTTDYLLGVSENRNGMDEEYFKSIDSSEDGVNIGVLSKATKILLDTASVATHGGAGKYIHDYYLLSLYRGALSLAKAGVLPREMFRLDYSLGRDLASAAIALQDAKFIFIEDKSRNGADFSKNTALNALIEEAEEYILTSFIIE